MEVQDVLIRLGLALMLVGALIAGISLIAKYFPRLETLPPILYVSYKLDGLSVGTSPIAIAVLLIAYLLFSLHR